MKEDDTFGLRCESRSQGGQGGGDITLDSGSTGCGNLSSEVERAEAKGGLLEEMPAGGMLKAFLQEMVEKIHHVGFWVDSRTVGMGGAFAENLSCQRLVEVEQNGGENGERGLVRGVGQIFHQFGSFLVFPDQTFV